MSQVASVEVAAQVIPVLLLTVLIDNRREGASLSDRPRRRSTHSEAMSSLLSLLAVIVATLGEVFALAALAVDRTTQVATALVYVALALLAMILLVPHLGLHLHVFSHRFSARTFGYLMSLTFLVLAAGLPWGGDPLLSQSAIWLRVSITILLVAGGLLFVPFFSERAWPHEYEEMDRIRWREYPGSSPTQAPDSQQPALAVDSRNVVITRPRPGSNLTYTPRWLRNARAGPSPAHIHTGTGPHVARRPPSPR